MHQPLRFETIEQAGQRRPFNGNALGQLALGGFVIETGQVQQHQPACLRESKISQASIQFSAPATRKLRQLHGKAMLLGVHVRPFLQKLIISELTTAPESRQDDLRSLIERQKS